MYIELLSKVEQSEFPDQWFNLAADNHFWMQWRTLAFLSQLRYLGIPLLNSMKGLEIGCGHGVVRRSIESITNWDIDGADIDYGALNQNENCRGRTFLYDIHDRNPELQNKYDFLILFDVIEHIEDERQFLQSALFHLKPGGWIFVNVPAMMWLWSRYDEVVTHQRRYRKDTMMHLLDGLSLNIYDTRYWGVTLVPPLLIRKSINTLFSQSTPQEIIRRGFKSPDKFINQLVSNWANIETSIISHPPLGTSLLTAARK